MRQSSLHNVEVAISREVQSEYDNIKLVAEAIDEVNALAGSDIVSLSTSQITDLLGLVDAADVVENLSFDVVTLAPGSEATVTQDGSNVILGIPRGVTGQDGVDGLTPQLDISYDSGSGDLTIEVIGYN